MVSLNGEILLKDIGNDLYEIKRIESDGINIGYKVFGNTLKTGKGILQIVYAAFPTDYELDDSIEGFDSRLSERVVALGTATEYSFITSEYTQASVYENRYKSALESVCRKKSDITIPPRRWI